MPTDQNRAEKYFGQLAKLTADQLSVSRLQMLLGDARRRISQPLNESELKARRQLTSDEPSTPENAGKAGLVYLPQESLNTLQTVSFSINLCEILFVWQTYEPLKTSLLR